MANPFKLFDEEHERLLRLFSQLAFLSKDIKDKKNSIIEKKETNNYYLSIKSLPIIIEYEYILEELDNYITLHDDLIRKVDLYSDVLMNECKEYLKNKEFDENIEENRNELERLRKIEQILKENNVDVNNVIQSLKVPNAIEAMKTEFDEATKEIIKYELTEMSKRRLIWQDYSTYIARLKKRLGSSMNEKNRTWILDFAYSLGYAVPNSQKAKQNMKNTESRDNSLVSIENDKTTESIENTENIESMDNIDKEKINIV